MEEGFAGATPSTDQDSRTSMRQRPPRLLASRPRPHISSFLGPRWRADQPLVRGSEHAVSCTLLLGHFGPMKKTWIPLHARWMASHGRTACIFSDGRPLTCRQLMTSVPLNYA